MLLAGDTVISNVSQERGTVVAPPMASGMVRVRFDGMRNAVDVHESRVKKITVTKQEDEDTEDPRYFKTGDYVQLTDGNGVSYKGAALDDFNRYSYATARLLTDDGQFLEVNTNAYNIVVLFRADVARGDLPKF